MKKLRIGLVILAICIAAWISFSAFRTFGTTPDQIKLVPYDEYMGGALDLVRSDVDKFFEIAVLILAGLWAIAIIDKDHRLRACAYDIPELIMFAIAMGLLILFFYFDHRFGEVLTQIYWDIGKLPGPRKFPDLLYSPYIDLHHRILVRCFYSALIVSALTAWSVVRLRGSNES